MYVHRKCAGEGYELEKDKVAFGYCEECGRQGTIYHVVGSEDRYKSKVGGVVREYVEGEEVVDGPKEIGKFKDDGSVDELAGHPVGTVVSEADGVRVEVRTEEEELPASTNEEEETGEDEVGVTDEGGVDVTRSDTAEEDDEKGRVKKALVEKVQAELERLRKELEELEG